MADFLSEALPVQAESAGRKGSVASLISPKFSSRGTSSRTPIDQVCHKKGLEFFLAGGSCRLK
jgi:hypothetical protein